MIFIFSELECSKSYNLVLSYLKNTLSIPVKNYGVFYLRKLTSHFETCMEICQFSFINRHARVFYRKDSTDFFSASACIFFKVLNALSLKWCSQQSRKKKDESFWLILSSRLIVRHNFMRNCIFFWSAKNSLFTNFRI